jgi:hypothetical protein
MSDTVLGPVELVGGPLDGTIVSDWPVGALYFVGPGWHSYQFDVDVERHRMVGHYVGASRP